MNLGEATIIITRATKPAGAKLRKYRVYLDDAKAAELANGSSITLKVKPGKHTVQVKLDWMASHRISVALVDGETVHLICAQGFPSVAALGVLFVSLFKRTGLLRLDRVDS